MIAFIKFIFLNVTISMRLKWLDYACPGTDATATIHRSQWDHIPHKFIKINSFEINTSVPCTITRTKHCKTVASGYVTLHKKSQSFASTVPVIVMLLP